MAIGTETQGSLNLPSTLQSLYTIKPTLGSIPNAGIMPISCHLDTAGPMCTCVQDTVDLLAVLMGINKAGGPHIGFAAAMKGSEGWKDLRIGTLDPEKFRYTEPLQTHDTDAIEQIVSITPGCNNYLADLWAAEISNYGGLRTYQAARERVSLRRELEARQRLRVRGFGLSQRTNGYVSCTFGCPRSNHLPVADFATDFDGYLAGTQGSSISSAKELAAWNEAHADVVLPAGQ